MRLRALHITVACLSGAGLAGQAWGQATQDITAADVRIGYQGLPGKAISGSENGLQLSDGVLMHMGVGAEAGYDSNVFYSENDPQGSPIIRVIPYLELTNTTRSGAAPSGAVFDLGASLTYREYLSNDEFIRQQRAFMPSAYGSLEFSARQEVSFGITDTFSRTTDPPYLNTGSRESIIRDTNQAFASVRWAPGGGRLATTLRYTNTLDYFETEVIRAANSMTHALMLDVAWKWLPKTAVFVNITQAYVQYLNTVNGATKSPSYPLHALAGMRGLITAKLSLSVAVGYANGFYADRPGPTGLRGNFSAGGDLTYRPTLLTSIGLGYRHDFQNAILGDFYYLDSVYLNVGQAIAGRLGFGLSARYESRTFEGVPLASGARISRHDNYFDGGANLDYRMRAWTYIGVSYNALINDSTYNPGVNTADPGRVNYVKHLVFARLGVTY